ncbi:MAG: alpha/beta hydrolase [Kiloniellales bacterium]
MDPTTRPAEPAPSILARAGDPSIAYRALSGSEPGLVFLGGFRSDMSGEKARALAEFAALRGQGLLRFDYRGHGLSQGRFEEGTVGLWSEDAIAVFDAETKGPQILIGSSMGAWIMVLLALARPERIAAMIGLAAAPDFTEDLIWQRLLPEEQARLIESGRLELPSRYGEQATPITLKLIEDGRKRLVLRRRIPLACPVRLIHGLSDDEVPWRSSLRLAEALDSRDVTVELVRGGEHRLSRPEDIERMLSVVAALSDRIGG